MAPYAQRLGIEASMTGNAATPRLMSTSPPRYPYLGSIEMVAAESIVRLSSLSSLSVVAERAIPLRLPGRAATGLFATLRIASGPRGDTGLK